MKKRILSFMMAASLISSCSMVFVSANGKADEYVSKMSTRVKICQLIMPIFRSSESGDVTEITEDIAASMKRNSYAGVILCGKNTPTNENTVRLVDAMQKANASEGSDRPQLLISIDQEGGYVTRLGQGTKMPGNMALGAINDVSVTTEVASMIGKELSALGVNTDFAPTVDVNNNPANPVIGVRSFSDDPKIVARQGSAFVDALNKSGVISTLKHFPGHGDTATDSHTGLPRIDKSYEELKQNELVPFKVCIDAGAQMIMTAHIQFPQIEKNTYKSKKTGENICLPATLSKTIISDVLRKDMGFGGVIVTDALEMGAIADHFDKYDVAKLAIEAGVDILLAPVDTSSKKGIEEMDTYINTLAAKADSGEFSIEKINAAVKRILDMKERNGLLSPYDGSNIESQVSEAVDHVGIKDSHDREWEFTKKAITLVKNEDGILPLVKPNQKTVVFVPYDEDIVPAGYAIGKLKEKGDLPVSTDIKVNSFQNKKIDEVFPMIDSADNVIFFSEAFGTSALKGDVAKMADSIADEIHRSGGKFIVLSGHLPYDAARYQKADAIMLAYLASGMPVDPTGKVKGIQQYGPNLPAALYMMFSKDDAPTAKLPVNIPKLNESGMFTDAILYPRGFGLTYEKNSDSDDKSKI